MRIAGTRCVVRSWRATDAASLVRHASNINVARQLRDRFPHPYRRENAAAFLKRVSAEDVPANFAIEVDREAVGGIGFVRGTDIERYSAEIGYWLGEQHWGCGITTEALTLLTADVFERLNLLRLFALPFADNIGFCTSSRRQATCGRPPAREQREGRDGARSGDLRKDKRRMAWRDDVRSRPVNSLQRASKTAARIPRM